MKKNILAVFTAAMVLSMNTFTIFAASPTVGTTQSPVATQKTVTSITSVESPAQYLGRTSVSDGFKAEAVSEKTVEAAAVAVQNEVLNDVASIGSLLGNSTLASAAADSSRKVTASILSVVDVSATSAVQVDGKYVVTLSIPGIAAGDAIVVLHYNGSGWEVIAPSSVAAGSVTFASASLSPVSVVKLDVSKVTASPKTGSAMPAAAAVLVIGLAGAAVCGRRVFA